MAAPPLVTLRGVDKVFANEVTALTGLDLEIRAGEFLSLLGPSGLRKVDGAAASVGTDRADARRNHLAANVRSSASSFRSRR